MPTANSRRCCSVRSTATDLFEQFANAYASGERPRAEEYVERAKGADAELLARMIDRFLASTPSRGARDEDAALLDSWLTEPALLRARVRRGLRRDEVVDALVRDLALDAAKRSKVRDYYHRLESGLLDPDRIDHRVYDALGRLFGTHVRALARWRPPRPEPAPAYYRSFEQDAEPPPLAPEAAAVQPDEVDRLFTGADPDA
jgi:hypothetical protein